MIKQGLTVGQTLQTQRASRKIPLESVARVTRIKLIYLEALEKDEFHLLPAQALVRGFLRNYAQCIHLERDELIALYNRQVALPESKDRDYEWQQPGSRGLSKTILYSLYNLIATLMGASPSMPMGKASVLPKD
jgi:cytoskeletal protein RodZ